MNLHNVTLRQLRALQAVIRTGSVTRAAVELHVTPSAVTMQLQQLQHLAGQPLLERHGNETVATDAGREILTAAERIEAAIADCSAMLSSLAGAEKGTVSIGVVSTAKYFAPQALAAFRRLHPGISLRLTVGNRAEILKGLQHFAIDVAIMGRPPLELDVEAEVIGDHPHLIVAPPDHPLAGQRDIPARLLAEETFLVREPGSGTRGLMERFFAKMRIDPPIAMQIDSNETIKQAVIACLGISFISGHTVGAELADGRMVALDVKGLPIVRQWYVVHLAQRRPVPAVRAIIDFLLERGGSFLPSIAATDAVDRPGHARPRQ
ncbi:LysR family transcriptional regulator [Oleomonas cavernae]|uniref:HTH-type transcriptional regulator CbbR n=1 Tax=Oleomonas cavernae TaxID=2320859 RepID=A0A418W8T4_9PROT|nr:LysR family transcriptional regulator [Oleomonas cavernae]RJF86406.1 LysR family transcriptional regulator [Oleomonas cavernae]